MRIATFLALALAGGLAAPLPVQAQNADLAALKAALARVRAENGVEALKLADKLADPVARSLVTWYAIRVTPKDVGFDRAARFLREHADWPTINLIRRRAEKLLYDEGKDAGTVRAFFASARPVSGEGKLALAKALQATGDKNGAIALLKSAWHEDELSTETEIDAFSSFPNVLGRADNVARALKLFAGERVEGAQRAADRAGADYAALGRARTAVIRKSGNAGSLLDAVPATLRTDPGYKLARVQYLRRKNDTAAAAKLIMEPPAVATGPDADLWWIERRLVLRRLLDQGDSRLAYRIAAEATTPLSENYKADQQFTAGWVALRFLNDARAAARHFGEIQKFSEHPLTLARGLYWLGRALEASGDPIGSRIQYEKAANHSIAYYGQLARARLGLNDLPLYRPPQATPAERAAFDRQEPVRALRLLFAIGENDIAQSIYLDLADRARDAASAMMLAEIAETARDARAMVLIAKAAIGRGLPVGLLGFPTFGLPNYAPVGPKVDSAMVFAIARQESQFDQRVVSIANAIGLMQVTPPTGRLVAKKFGLAFDRKRLASDPVYNTQLGAAELGNLLEAYRGSYLLAFIGYNAGSGRVSQWIAQYGDPRDPKVDTVDWIERIPISETRFYVQRVMENLQVYRALAGARPALTIEADLVRGRVN
jgi:soluble lytic murein transglycosylase